MINPIYENFNESDNNSDYESYDLYSVYGNKNELETNNSKANLKPKKKLSYLIYKYFLCCLKKK